MAKESTRLLVVADTAERAQEIDSLLRNSGIALRVDAAETSSELSDALDSDPPFLLILCQTDPARVQAPAVLKLAEKHAIPLVVRIDPEKDDVLPLALQQGMCRVIHARRPEQLLAVVEEAREQSGAASDASALQHRLEELESRYQLLLDSANDAVSYFHEGLHVYANPAYLEALGVESFDTLAAVSLLELVESDKVDLKALIRAMGEGEFPPRPVQVTLHRPDGQEMEAQLEFSPARFDGEDCIQMMLAELRDPAGVEAELDRLRSQDPVTGLANRQAFYAALESFFESRDDGQAAAVLYLEPADIDTLQDELSIGQMDAFLADFSQQLTGGLAAGDEAGRISDHGFCIVAQRGDAAALEQLGEELIERVRSHIVELDDLTLTTGCSVGLSLLGALEQKPGELVNQARRAFDQAARDGNRVVRYRPMFAAVVSEEEDRQWAERIRYALNHQDFYSVQQAIVDLEGDGEDLFEIRTFMREDDGDRGPDEYMPAAERSELGSMIDRHVIPGILAGISNPHERHFVPISGNTVLDFSFAKWLKRQFEDIGVQGSQVVLQMPAQIVENNLKVAQRLLEELAPTGCRFALGHVTPDRRTLQLIEHLDIGYLKLDPVLTTHLTGEQERQMQLRNIVDLAAPHDVTVVAPEVRDASDMAVLWQCGVKLVTGDFLKEAPKVVGQ